MRIRLHKEIGRLTKRAISLGALVEERLRMASQALEFTDTDLAQRVIDGDIEIDELEVDIEEDCLKILALHKTVADHLRSIITILKINNDLERIGDLAVNIAQSAQSVAKQTRIANRFDRFAMARVPEQMLENSLDSLANLDLSLAFQILSQDDQVDSMKSAVQEQFTRALSQAPDNVESMIDLFLVSRHLERIADHATNIAEAVIYLITGAIHRHREIAVVRGSETWFHAGPRVDPD